jgi:Na+/H+-dicarboxylate symporter
MNFFRVSLAVQMAIATVLGVFVGLFLGDLCSFFAPYGSAYIMLLKATAIPYLIVAIINGIGQLSSFQAKTILKKGLMFIGMAWFVNIAMIYLVYFSFPKAKGNLSGYISTESPQINFAELLIPENIFYDLANNIIPAIVIFSLFLGIALMHIKEKETLMSSLKNLVDALSRITSWIAKITPIGTFLIIANQVGTIQLSTIKQISSYIILYIICICLIVFWIFPRITNMLTHIKTYRWIEMLSPILLLAYTTNIVIVCIPFIIELLRKETQALEPFDDKSPTQIQGTVSVVFNLPLGSLFITLFVLFVSIFYNHPLTVSSQFELFLTSFLTSLGAVGIGSWINSLTFLLDSLGLPQEAINLYLTALPFTSGFQATISAMQVATISFLITLACRRHIHISYLKVLKQSVLTIAPVVLLFLVIKIYSPLPEIKSLKKSIYELSISSDINVTFDNKDQQNQSLIDGEETFKRILRTKKLRVGYNPSISPFCFRNSDNHVVGYDMAFAYELAYDLGCNLELVPCNYSTLIKDLKNDVYDIAMSAISVNEERLKHISFTQNYMLPRYVFVTYDSKKSIFKSLSVVQRDELIKIAVQKGTSYETLAKEIFPHHTIITLNSYEDFFSSGADVILWEEQQAIAWSIGKRNIRVIFPSPLIGYDSLAYAIKSNNPRFLNYLNQWLELKKTEGYTKKQYELWIDGKTEIAAPHEPRWSIIRNVLQWTE